MKNKKHVDTSKIQPCPDPNCVCYQARMVTAPVVDAIQNCETPEELKKFVDLLLALTMIAATKGVELETGGKSSPEAEQKRLFEQSMKGEVRPAVGTKAALDASQKKVIEKIPTAKTESLEGSLASMKEVIAATEAELERRRSASKLDGFNPN